LIKEEQRKENEAEGEGEEEEDSDEIDFTDIANFSVLDQYRSKNESLSKELQDKEGKIKLLQNE